MPEKSIKVNSFVSNLIKNIKLAASEPPNYRPAEDPGVKCGTCKHYDNATTLCTKYDTGVSEDYVCDAFERKKVKLRAVTESNIERPDLLSKISAVLSQAQAGMMPPPPPPGGGMPPGGAPPMDPMMMMAMGGGMPPPGGGGMPPPPPGGGSPLDMALAAPPPPGGSDMGMGGGMPPPPPSTEEPGKEEKPKEEEKSEKSTDEKLDELISKLDRLIELLEKKMAIDEKGPASTVTEEKTETSHEPVAKEKTSSASDDVLNQILQLLND
jgi:hypothetical protein